MITPTIKRTGVEYNRKNFVSILFNANTNQYEVGFNMYFKTINSKVFHIDDDYDFGPIDPIDSAIEMYNDASLSLPGISRKA